MRLMFEGALINKPAQRKMQNNGPVISGVINLVCVSENL